MGWGDGMKGVYFYVGGLNHEGLAIHGYLESHLRGHAGIGR